MTNDQNTPPAFVPLDQLGAYATETSTDVVLRRAQALYDADPTDAHYENLMETRYEHNLMTGKRSGRRS